ncbi:hypothetical protein KDU71_11375 [Carboxylicivirga sediminis]|uniref:LamG-like jellyroll fold domain-containing protein n=1 Tax=Carboxylicivirga sediminis TaxID=2006564 RepID=A0A941IXL0_9BACT|nr:LamG-like jellyroll fold domain-containing protein [Carboxylicivirga sediminis]MBR8536160.1 hypothetical protein [Carboxylicivirga sediminis]
MKHYLVIVISILVISRYSVAQEFDTWRFINIPDYHNAEGLSRNIPEREQRLTEQTAQFKDMKKRYGGELIIMPGDCNGGHWYRPKYLKLFRAHPDYTNYSTKEVILEASRLCYSGLWDMVHDGGYEHFLMAVGDHELGDNPWQKSTEVVKHISTFRQGFANTFTLKDDGQSRFTEKIGKALPRPVGTKYEHTSNAVQYKNVLFVTLDMFHYDADDIVLGSEGVVTGDIDGNHLQWFESVLSEAQNIASIKHIVVQSHLPIIYPVRKYASSGMLVDKKESEKILNVLRKYKVDLYLAGEVHMNTVTKDPESDLIQLVARGNNLSNMTLVDVDPDKLSINTFHWNGDHLGCLTIDKSGRGSKIEGDRLLKPIHPKGLQIHWSFDEQLNEQQYKSSVDGTFPKKSKHNVFLSEISNPNVYSNGGGFNKDYSLIGTDAKIVKGIIGNAIAISESSKLFVLPMGPFHSSYARTVSCWVKTSADGKRLILNSGSFWGKSGQFFNLALDNGNLQVAIRPDAYITTNKQIVNDDQWHHLAVVMTEDATLQELKLFVDGKRIDDVHMIKPSVKILTSQANWMAIATQGGKYKTDYIKEMGMHNYIGLLDDVAIWTRAMNDSDISKLYSEGMKGIGASDVESIIRK